jgi:glycosyltransferase involved in cell wall biosynthesis
MSELTVAHIDTQRTWRGGERQALALMKGLRAQGIRNLLICKPGSEIGARATSEKFDCRYLPLAGEWDVVSAFRLRKILKDTGVDIVHTHTSHGHMIALMAVVLMPDVKLVVSRRVDFHVSNMFSLLIKYGPRVDAIITVSDAIRRILIEDGIESRKITTVHSGFIAEEFADTERHEGLHEKFCFDDSQPVIVNVAALAPHKAQYTLIKAAAEVIKEHPKARFLIAGEGELRDNLERQIEEYGLSGNVFLLGFIKNIASVYKTGDIFALSSREEGLCTSLFDAMFFGLPIVATRAGGIPELVKDGKNGYLVDIDDYRSFAEKVIRLIDKPDERGNMGRESRVMVDEYTINKTVDKTLAVYAKLKTRT